MMNKIQQFTFDQIIIFLDKVKFNNPKKYAIIVIIIGLLYLLQIILPLFGVELPSNDILETIINFISILFLGIANPKTNRYLIEKELKDKSEYTIKN